MVAAVCTKARLIYIYILPSPYAPFVAPKEGLTTYRGIRGLDVISRDFQPYEACSQRSGLDLFALSASARKDQGHLHPHQFQAGYLIRHPSWRPLESHSMSVTNPPTPQNIFVFFYVAER